MIYFLLAEGKICLSTHPLTHEKEKIYTAHTVRQVCDLSASLITKCTRAIPPTTWAYATITIINREHVEAARQAARGGGGILVASLWRCEPRGHAGRAAAGPRRYFQSESESASRPSTCRSRNRRVVAAKVVRATTAGRVEHNALSVCRACALGVYEIHITRLLHDWGV